MLQLRERKRGRIMWNNIQSFKDDFMFALETKLDPGYMVITNKVAKLNNVMKTGISLQNPAFPSNTIPTIYLEDLYESYGNENINIDSLASQLYEQMVHAPNTDSVSEILNPEFVKEHVQIKVISSEMNGDFLRDKPCIPVNGFDDLVAIAVVKLDSEDFRNSFGSEHSGSITVTDGLMLNLSIRKSELFECALRNSEQNNPASLRSMREVMIEMMFPDGKPEDDPMVDMFLPPEGDEAMMYVLTNRTAMFGASTIMYSGIMDEVYNKVGSDFVIIPSSLHEVLIVKDADLMSNNEILNMVSQINEGVVADCDILSNNIYRYSGADKCVATIRASGAESDLSAEL